MKKKITIEDLAVMVNRGFIDMEKRMATKEDLKGFATKEDLKGFATKEDLKGFATKEDITQLRTEMRDGFYAVNHRLDSLHEDISDLPDIREEIRDYDERLARVEHKIRLVK